MNTRLIKKQLGSILYDNLLVPRTTSPSKVGVANRLNRSKCGLIDTDSNNQYQVKYNTDFNGKKHGYIFRLPHFMYYKADSKQNSNTVHHKGDVRMKHISSLDEFEVWYKDSNSNMNKVVASLQQFSKSLAQALSKRPNNVQDDSQPSNSDSQSSDNHNDSDNPFGSNNKNNN